MTYIVIMESTASLFPKKYIDELLKKGSVKLIKNDITYLSIKSEDYIELDLNTLQDEK